MSKPMRLLALMKKARRSFKQTKGASDPFDTIRPFMGADTRAVVNQGVAEVGFNKAAGELRAARSGQTAVKTLPDMTGSFSAMTSNKPIASKASSSLSQAFDQPPYLASIGERERGMSLMQKAASQYQDIQARPARRGRAA